MFLRWTMIQNNLDYTQKLKQKLLDTPDSQGVIYYALQQVAKNNAVDLVVETYDMDDDFCDYNYICPICNRTINDSNEAIGSCDCGQVFNDLNFDDWIDRFKNTHKWVVKSDKWFLRSRL